MERIPGEPIRISRNAVLIIMFIATVFLYNHFFVKDGPPGNIEIMTMTQLLVEKELKAPTTAKHPDLENYKIKSLGENRFEVSSYVDAQNSFGAMIRTYYYAVVRNMEKDKWRLEKIQWFQ